MEDYTTCDIGTVITLRLPVVDQRYKLQHAVDKPLMLYPGEVTKEYVDEKGNKYCISNYGRIYSYKKQTIVKTISGVYLTSWFKNNFTEEELNNPYTEFNLKAISPTSYYQRHKAERLAYQKAYRDNNLEKVRANEKKYRDANHDKILERARQRRAERKATLTEEQKEEIRAKNREYYRRKKEKAAQQSIEPTVVELPAEESVEEEDTE